MNAHRLRPILRRRNLVPLTAFLLLSVVAFCGFAASGARPRQGSAATPARDERKFENTVPEHVPIKVRLRSEKSFKDLKNKDWARELEIEVKNTGSKPIYYVYVVLTMPEIKVQGHELSMRTKYGRKELALPETSIEPSDVPIPPGGVITLRLPEDQVRGYEKARDNDGMYHDPKRVLLEVLIIKFGDGTYLLGPDGKLMHGGHKERSANAASPNTGPGDCK